MRLVDDVTLSVREGEVLGIAGLTGTDRRYSPTR